MSSERNGHVNITGFCINFTPVISMSICTLRNPNVAFQCFSSPKKNNSHEQFDFSDRWWIGKKLFWNNYKRKIQLKEIFMRISLNIVSRISLRLFFISMKWSRSFALVSDNRLLENYSITLMRCTEQEREIQTLRQENTELQKNSARYVQRKTNGTIIELFFFHSSEFQIFHETIESNHWKMIIWKPKTKF